MPDTTYVDYMGALHERRKRVINDKHYLFMRYESTSGHVILQANRWKHDFDDPNANGSYAVPVHVIHGTAPR